MKKLFGLIITLLLLFSLSSCGKASKSYDKLSKITKEIGKQPVLAFGNSDGDTSMLNYAISNTKYKGQGYMLVADDIDRDYANLEKAESLRTMWIEKNFHVISMKNDFKTIYGDNVLKTN